MSSQELLADLIEAANHALIRRAIDASLSSTERIARSASPQPVLFTPRQETR
jgi:hypothetical protein